MEAETLRELVLCDPQKIKEVAQRVDIPFPAAQLARQRFVRQLLGTCIMCGRTKGTSCCAKCTKIYGEVEIQFTPIAVLKKLKSEDGLLQRKCIFCADDFVETVGSVLQKLGRGKLRLEQKCPECKVKRRKMQAKKALRGELKQNPFKQSATLQKVKNQLRS